MDIPALPFSKLKKSVRKPLGDKYISNPTTFGEKLRNRRLELQLLQKDVALIVGVSEDCITYWENERSLPQRRHYKKLTDFLGYNLFSEIRKSKTVIT